MNRVAAQQGEIGRARMAALRVCVAIPTFRRIEMLANLLAALEAQVLTRTIDLTVLVLDNDAQPSAHETVAQRQEHSSFGLEYLHVARPGLCSVRNTALDYAYGRYDFLAMIDDDELPVPSWLDELLLVADRTKSQVVIGAVPQMLPPLAPSWIRTGRFFDLPTYPDGAEMPFGYSGNCLIDVRFLERTGVRFDEELNFAGGEDFIFFKQLQQKKARLCFAARAVAVEAVPVERCTATYLLRLNYRRGNTLAICDRKTGNSSRSAIVRAIKATARIAVGTIKLVPLTISRGKRGAMAAIFEIAQGAGGLRGVGGHIYHAYVRNDSSLR